MFHFPMINRPGEFPHFKDKTRLRAATLKIKSIIKPMKSMLKLFADMFIPPSIIPVLFGEGLDKRYGTFSSKKT